MLAFSGSILHFCMLQGLRFNRCLLLLGLANNCIGDVGAKRFAAVS